MSELTDQERLIKVETNLTNLTETVKDGFTKTSDAITKIDGKLDSTFSTFVTKDEFKTYKSSQNTQKVLLSVLMIIVGALVGYFISNVSR